MPEPSFKMIYKPCVGEMKAMAKRTDRATMWGLRETGRLVRREARRTAPVYKGDRGDIEVGLLKKSIGPSKKLKRIGREAYSLKIGPRGERVHLYAPKQEAAIGFMKKAHEVAVPVMGAVFDRGWRKAMDRK